LFEKIEINSKNALIRKNEKVEKIFDFTSSIFNNIYSVYSSKIIYLIFNNLSKAKIINNSNAITNNQNSELVVKNILEIINNSNSNSIKTNKGILNVNNEKNLPLNNNSYLLFKACLLNIFEFELILDKIKGLVTDFVNIRDKTNNNKNKLVNLIWDFFSAESNKKNFKIIASKDFLSIKDYVNRLNKFLRNDDVNIPIPNFANLKKSASEMLFIKSVSYINAEDIFSSMEKPIKLTLWSQEIYNSESGKLEKLKYTYILKKANDSIKEYKTSQIFLSIYSMLNFPQNKVDRKITKNFKCYEIVTIGKSIILIEFLQSSNPLKKKINQVKSEYFIDDVFTMNLEFKILQNNDKSIKECLYKYHPRNLLLTYFYNNFQNPLEFYKMKKNYIVSFAIWSMCSYIVRLGDRHLENLMINNTNQLIYIDYGYVLNDGLNLPVPEIVPIRFTNNLRYALGFLEETGIFSNICMKVLKVIYKHSYIIFPQMKAILDSVKENAKLQENAENDENWLLKEKLGKDTRR